MIFGKLKDIKRYKGMNNNLDKAIDYILNNDLLNLPTGSQVIDQDLKYIRETYYPRDVKSCNYEAHQKYLDIQIVLKGQEGMGYSDISAHLEILDNYDQEKDVAKLQVTPDQIFVMTDSNFAIVFPEDLHMPKIKIVEDSLVEKAVIKVKL